MPFGKRALLCVLAFVIVCFVGVSARAEASWRDAYAGALKKEASGGITAAALCDFTGDGVPEMACLTRKAGGAGALSIYRYAGGAATRLQGAGGSFDFDRMSFPGVKSVKAELRSDASGAGAISLTVTCKGATYFYAFRVAGESAEVLFSSMNAGTKYYIEQTAVSKATYAARRNAFVASWPRRGGALSMQTVSSKDSAAAIDKKMGVLASKYAVFSRVKKLSLSKSAVSVPRGGTYALRAKITPASAIYDEIAWTSSDASVASVSGKGVVTGVRPGVVTVTASAKNGARKSCRVTVMPPDPVSVTLSHATIEMGKGDTEKLTFSVLPADASTAAVWSSSRKSVATVSSTGVVTAKGAGSATVTVKTRGGRIDKCVVNVVTAPASVALSASSKSILAGSTATLTAKVLPAAVSQKVTWTSGNSFIASVSDAGVVTARRAGATTITAATANGKKASCAVTVKASGDTYIVDISQYNTVSDWDKLARCADLVILRATCGTAYDTKFQTYAAGCAKYGIPFGVYCYGKADTAAAAGVEAETLYGRAAKYKPLFYVYDVEKSTITRAVASAFNAKLRALGAKKVGYYISHNLYGTLSLNTKEADFIWIPRYGENTGYLDKVPVYPCDMHQYTSMGYIPGMTGRVDLNRLTGAKPLSWFLS